MSDKSDTSLAERLSALMDGELPEDEARFLRRRLEHDLDLRAAWSRLHLASSCLKGHAVQPLALDCAAVRAAEPASAGRRGWMRWAAAASVAVLAVSLAPRLMQAPQAPAKPDTAVASTPVPRLLPSPASADLVAFRVAPRVASPGLRAATPVASSGAGAPLVAAAPSQSSPLPLDSQSPADFPLVDTGEKAWPKSGLPAVGNDPQLEAYLVRHNQMLSNDGLGGFVPYVDVVARDPARSAADAEPEPEPATK
jgi:hypothetical protein